MSLVAREIAKKFAQFKLLVSYFLDPVQLYHFKYFAAFVTQL